MDKVRAWIVARPLVSALVLTVGGVLIEWATKFLASLQGSPF